MRFRRRDAIARARLTVRANRGGGKLGGNPRNRPAGGGDRDERSATPRWRLRRAARYRPLASTTGPHAAHFPSRAMATTAWLLAPIRATRAIPTLWRGRRARQGGVRRRARRGSGDSAGSPIEGADASSSRPASTDDPPPAPRRPLGVGRPLPPGDYHLDDDPSAVLRYEPRAMRCAPDAYEELWNFSLAVAPTPNPPQPPPQPPPQRHLRRAIPFRRNSSARTPRGTRGPPSSARASPTPAPACIPSARDANLPNETSPRTSTGTRTVARGWDATATPSPISFPTRPSLVHVHVRRRRVAAAFVRSASYRHRRCFLSPRCRRARRRYGPAGTTQEGFEHAVRTTAAKAHAGVSRVNVTVRAFKLD